MYFPRELREGKAMVEFMNELRLATYSGFKGHDDCIDTISQLAYVKLVKPSMRYKVQDDTVEDFWGNHIRVNEPMGIDGYVV